MPVPTPPKAHSGPDCGGDRLRSDFTGSGRCHAPMGDAS